MKIKLLPEGPFLTSRRKMIELLVLIGINILLYFLFSSWEVISLFTFGFIWNWVASHELVSVSENRRYRFSMVRLVKNLEFLILKPLDKAPRFVKWIARVLPAGVFWSMVIYFNDSEMPWWVTFVGSLTYELMQIEINSFKQERETAP